MGHRILNGCIPTGSVQYGADLSALCVALPPHFNDPDPVAKRISQQIIIRPVRLSRTGAPFSVFCRDSDGMGEYGQMFSPAAHCLPVSC
jgi:hypothetical protein